MTDDDGAIESGHSPDPGSGLGSAPEQSPATPPGPASHDQLAVPLTEATAAGPAVPAPASSAGPATRPSAHPATTAPPDGTAPPLDIDQIASQVYERIGDKLDHRPDPAQDTPPAERAIMLRDKAPELYDLWLKIAQEKAATSNYVQRAPYEVPERLAQSGRPRALSAIIVVLVFCGYLVSLGGPGPYIGGLIAILDLLVMLALFFGLRPDHLTESGRPRKRRLIRAAPCGRPVRPASAGGPAWRPGRYPDVLSPPGPDAPGGLSSYRRISARPASRISTTAWSADWPAPGW
jgi:hypothetical protein